MYQVDLVEPVSKLACCIVIRKLLGDLCAFLRLMCKYTRVSLKWATHNRNNKKHRRIGAVQYNMKISSFTREQFLKLACLKFCVFSRVCIRGKSSARYLPHSSSSIVREFITVITLARATFAMSVYRVENLECEI